MVKLLTLYICTCSLFLFGSIVRASESTSVCLDPIEGIESPELFFCGSCFISGNCGFEVDYNKAIPFYEKSGDGGFVLGYALAAWFMLETKFTKETRAQFLSLIQKGKGDEVGLSDYLAAMVDLASADSKMDFRRVFKLFERYAYNGGLTTSFLSMHFMLEHSECAGSLNDDLIRQERLVSAMRQSKPFTLDAWNKEVNKQEVNGMILSILKNINTDWQSSLLKSDWCKEPTQNIDENSGYPSSSNIRKLGRLEKSTK